MHTVGVLLVVPVLPLLVTRIGVRRLMLCALLLAATVLLAFALMRPIWTWFVLRVLLGMASEVLFVLSETWTNHLSSERARARSMAVYMAAMSLGFAAGPLLLSFTGTDGALPFLAGTMSERRKPREGKSRALGQRTRWKLWAIVSSGASPKRRR